MVRHNYGQIQMVRFRCSTIPSYWGCKAVVLVFRIPTLSYMLRKSNLSKLRPSFEYISRGTPRRLINCFYWHICDFLVWIGVSFHIFHKMYLFPSFDFRLSWTTRLTRTTLRVAAYFLWNLTTTGLTLISPTHLTPTYLRLTPKTPLLALIRVNHLTWDARV